MNAPEGRRRGDFSKRATNLRSPRRASWDFHVGPALATRLSESCHTAGSPEGSNKSTPSTSRMRNPQLQDGRPRRGLLQSGQRRNLGRFFTGRHKIRVEKGRCCLRQSADDPRRLKQAAMLLEIKGHALAATLLGVASAADLEVSEISVPNRQAKKQARYGASDSNGWNGGPDRYPYETPRYEARSGCPKNQALGLQPSAGA